MTAAIDTAMTIPIPMYSIYFDPSIVSIICFVIFVNIEDSNTNPYLPSFGFVFCFHRTLIISPPSTPQNVVSTNTAPVLCSLIFIRIKEV